MFVKITTSCFTSLKDMQTDNKLGETGEQEGEKETTSEALDELDFNFPTKKKKKKKKACESLWHFWL